MKTNPTKNSEVQSQNKPIESPIEIDHPYDIGEEWHICRDFIDRYAKKLGDWRHKPTIEENIDSLKRLVNELDITNGLSRSADAWERVRVWFSINETNEFFQRFKSRTVGALKKIYDTLASLEKMVAKQENVDCWEVEAKSLELYLEQYFLYFHYVSQELKKKYRFPKGKKNAISNTANTLKSKRGRKPSPVTLQRRAFSTPLRKEGCSWPEIFARYHERYPDDKKASEATLRLSCTRREKKRKRKEGNKSNDFPF